MFSSWLTRGPEGSARRSASLRSCGMEPSRILPISSIRPPSALPASARLGAPRFVVRRLGRRPLGVQRAELPLELADALLGQGRLQAQILGFLVDARHFLLELGGLAPRTGPLAPEHRRQHHENQAGGDEGPGAPRRPVVSQRAGVLLVLWEAIPSHVASRLAPRGRAPPEFARVRP